MTSGQSKPILYLITPGATTNTTTPDSLEFKQLIELVSVAAAAGIDLVQLREKRLSARVLFELTRQAVALTHRVRTRVLVNDRADIAAGAGAQGVHLTTRSIDAQTIRRIFGDDFVISVSTHSVEEARAAKEAGADFIVFGPVFETSSKREYGPPVGVHSLSNAIRELGDFKTLALGGITLDNFALCLNAGASGIAGISLFSKSGELGSIVAQIKNGIAQDED